MSFPFSLYPLTVTCLTLKMHLIKKHNSPLMRMSFWDVLLSEQGNMFSSWGAALILSSRKEKKLCFCYWPCLGKTVFQRQRQYQGNETFGSHYELQAVSCIQLLTRHYTKKALERFLIFVFCFFFCGDSCHFIYQPL